MNSVSFGANTFCGPSVISAIAGINTDEATAVLLSTSPHHRRTIRSVYMSELKLAFNELGFSAVDVKPCGYSVFGSLAAISRAGASDGYYVFMVPGHFIAIELNGIHKYICDNHSKTPVNMAASARLGQRVVSIIKVTRYGNCKSITEVQE